MTRLAALPRLVLPALLLAVAAPASADPLPLSAPVEVGAPAQAVTVEAAASEDGLVITARLGARSATETVHAEVTEASLERVEVAPGHAVAILRARGDGSEVAAVIGAGRQGPAILWRGRTDLHGDPGERAADVLSLEDRTGDGLPDVVVGVRREGAGLCRPDGASPSILMARAYDPASGRMRPVTLRRVGDGPQTAVIATLTSPGPEGPPLVSALEARGASSTSGHGEEERTGLAPPRALVDGRADTFWAEGRGGPGGQEYAVLRFNARYPVRAFAVIPSPTGDVARRLGRPRRFWLVGDGGARLEVTLPDDAVAHPGERYWIVPPEPVTWRCVALVLDTAYPPRGVRADAVHTGVAELEAYTELDFGGGIEALVGVLVRGGREGDEATRLLTGLGAPATQALAASWDRLDAQGRRRAARVFASHARRAVPGALEALARATRDESAEVRAQAIEALGTLGPEATPILAALVQEPAPRGDEAVRALLRHPPAAAVPALLAALQTEGGSERPTLREGLAASLVTDARGGPTDADAHPGRDAFEAWIAEEPPVAAFASAALGVASRTGVRELVATRLAVGTGRASRFEDRWRLVRAARDLPAEAETDRWLGTVAAHAEEWMLRAAAVEALGRRRSEDREAVARAALADDYPRVRMEAVHVLDELDVADAELIARARRDRWPMVRAAAVEALFQRDAGAEAVREASRDRSARVRAAAIGTLTRAGDREAWPLVEARLADDNEWPRVTVMALRYVRELCVAEAGEHVLAVIRRGAQPDAWAPDVDVAALAMDTALRLGGDTAEDAQRIAARESTPASIRAAARRQGGPPPTCRPR